MLNSRLGQEGKLILFDFVCSLPCFLLGGLFTEKGLAPEISTFGRSIYFSFGPPKDRVSSISWQVQ